MRTAKFEVSGIITKMELETRKDGSQTGNGIVRLDMIGYQGTIIPIKLTVPQVIMEGFGQAGFYETGSAKFTGHIINTSKEEEVRENLFEELSDVLMNIEQIKYYQVGKTGTSCGLSFYIKGKTNLRTLGSFRCQDIGELKQQIQNKRKSVNTKL